MQKIIHIFIDVKLECPMKNAVVSSTNLKDPNVV